MNIIQLSIPDVILLEPQIFKDARGIFFESFNQQKFQEFTGQKIQFVQDNLSRSVKGVLRGLHYQLPPKEQGKLVRVINGAVFDVAVDIRADSPTLGKWVGVELNSDNNRQLWVPPGFAHGFLVLSETADVLYKTTEYYSPEHERSLKWDDLDLAIDWPCLGKQLLVSDKDANAASYQDCGLKLIY